MTEKRYVVGQAWIDHLIKCGGFVSHDAIEIPEGTLFPTQENLEAMLDRVAIDDWDRDRFKSWIELWRQPGEIYESQEGKEEG